MLPTMMSLPRSVLLFLTFLFALLQCFVPCFAGDIIPKAECLPIAEDPNSFTCVVTTTAQEQTSLDQCVDEHDECSAWQRRKECSKNPGYMLQACRASCQSCLGLHIGETQAAPDANWRQAIFQKLVETRQYVYEQATKTFQMFHQCKNDHEMCTYWAVNGDCDKEEMKGFLHKSCRAACQTCHI